MFGPLREFSFDRELVNITAEQNIRLINQIKNGFSTLLLNVGGNSQFTIKECKPETREMLNEVYAHLGFISFDSSVTEFDSGSTMFEEVLISKDTSKISELHYFGGKDNNTYSSFRVIASKNS